METVENKYITVAYKLYTVEDGEKELFEETNAEHPFQFISGLPFRQMKLTEPTMSNMYLIFLKISLK